MMAYFCSILITKSLSECTKIIYPIEPDSKKE